MMCARQSGAGDPPEPAERTGVPVQRVFISCAREDAAWARETARTLRGVGVEVFLDTDTLRAGENWPERLRDEIDRADQVRLGWSRFAEQSRWVEEEYTRALAKDAGTLLIEG